MPESQQLLCIGSLACPSETGLSCRGLEICCAVRQQLVRVSVCDPTVRVSLCKLKREESWCLVSSPQSGEDSRLEQQLTPCLLGSLQSNFESAG